MRTRMYGGVGGEEPRGFPLSRLYAERVQWLGELGSERAADGVKEIGSRKPTENDGYKGWSEEQRERAGVASVTYSPG